LLLLFGASQWDLGATPVEAQETGVSQEWDSPSQTPGGSAGDSESALQNEKPQKQAHQKRGAFVVAPLPISSPAVGSGIVPVVAYIFPTSSGDKISPPSVVGAVGLVTDNGSRALALGGEVYFKQNSFRTAATYARGNLRRFSAKATSQTDRSISLRRIPASHVVETLPRAQISLGKLAHYS